MTRLAHKSLLWGFFETMNECILQQSGFYSLSGSRGEMLSENHSALRKDLVQGLLCDIKFTTKNNMRKKDMHVYTYTCLI